MHICMCMFPYNISDIFIKEELRDFYKYNVHYFIFKIDNCGLREMSSQFAIILTSTIMILLKTIATQKKGRKKKKKAGFDFIRLQLNRSYRKFFWGVEITVKTQVKTLSMCSWRSHVPSSLPHSFITSKLPPPTFRLLKPPSRVRIFYTLLNTMHRLLFLAVRHCR